MDQIAERCPSILCIHNDLYIYGKTEKEDDSNLLTTM